MKFKVGDQVHCIDTTKTLERGVLYTVTEVDPTYCPTGWADRKGGIRVRHPETRKETGPWYQFRFELAPEPTPEEPTVGALVERIATTRGCGDYGHEGHRYFVTRVYDGGVYTCIDAVWEEDSNVTITGADINNFKVVRPGVSRAALYNAIKNFQGGCDSGKTDFIRTNDLTSHSPTPGVTLTISVERDDLDTKRKLANMIADVRNAAGGKTVLTSISFLHSELGDDDPVEVGGYIADRFREWQVQSADPRPAGFTQEEVIELARNSGGTETQIEQFLKSLDISTKPVVSHDGVAEQYSIESRDGSRLFLTQDQYEAVVNYHNAYPV